MKPIDGLLFLHELSSLNIAMSNTTIEIQGAGEVYHGMVINRRVRGCKGRDDALLAKYVLRSQTDAPLVCKRENPRSHVRNQQLL